MPLTKEENTKVQNLAPVYDSYLSWQKYITRFLHAPLEEKAAFAKLAAAPQELEVWINGFEADSPYRPMLEELRILKNELHQCVNTMLATGAGDEHSVSHEVVETYSTLFERFLLNLKHIEMRLIQGASSIDRETGLFDLEALKADYDKDMERLVRYEHPFCLLYGRIKNYHSGQKAVLQDREMPVIRAAAFLLRSTIRSFDEAYRIGENEFILSCKIVKKPGGMAVTRRIEKLVEGRHIVVRTEGGQEEPLSFSFCVADPVQGDALEQLLSNMREELNAYDDKSASGTAIELREQSELEKYLAEQG